MALKLKLLPRPLPIPAPKPAVSPRNITVRRERSFADVCKLPWYGNPEAPIMLLVDPTIYDPDKEAVPKGAVSGYAMRGMTPFMKEAGIQGKDVVFVAACPAMTKNDWDRDKAVGEALKASHDHFREAVAALKPKLIISMGKAAARQVTNKAVKVTKVRGTPYRDPNLNTLVMPTLGIAHVLRVPEHGETYAADLRTAKRLIDNGYQLDSEVGRKRVTRYDWCTDLSDWVRNPPKFLCVDSESSAFGEADFPHWYHPATKVLTVQLSAEAGVTRVVPIDYPGYPVPPSVRAKLITQLRAILTHKDVRIVGHNFKHDWLQFHAKLGITIPKQNYSDDTLLIAHLLNENALSKGLEDLTRIHLPEIAGHKDAFLQKGYSYGRMDLVPPDDFIEYAGADTDTGLQLFEILINKLKSDEKLYKCYTHVVMPALRAFCDIEQNGFRINEDALRRLYVKVSEHQNKEYKRLIAMVPKQVIADNDNRTEREKQAGVPFSLTRPAFLRSYLFTHPKGLRLKPRVFTKSTANLAEDKREASVSTKQHLPYFVGKHPFIEGIMAFIKNEKMLTTYIGQEAKYDNFGNIVEPETGFWQYIHEGFIRPSYILHGTVTGRTASRDPNGQNFPKRGDFAKAYRELFEAPDGWVIIEADYSQLELRIAGILAKEPTFLKIYAEGGDIHCATAAVVMGISLEEFMALKQSDPDTFALQRYRAKAVNFGFIYGMGWRKFMVYAKTDYGIDYTEAEAKRIREAFFTKYSALGRWHDAVKAFVRKHKYVRALDGRVRHLPAVVVDDDGVASSAERQAVNSPVQGFGSDLGLISLARLNADADKSWLRVIGFVHDAVICIAKKGREMDAARMITQYMGNLPLVEWFGFKSPIPIKSEASIGYNLAKMIELKEKWLADKTIKTYEQVKALDDAAKGKAPEPPKSERKLTVRPKPVQSSASRLRVLPPPRKKAA